LSNGTHEFVPTVLLISLDGFRADFLTPTLTPHLYNLSQSLTPNYFSPSASFSSNASKVDTSPNAPGVGIDIGAVNPPYLLPSFPSVTFPNHYTLITGLYPSSHGIIGNEFWDPSANGGKGAEFVYTDPERSHDSFWWEGVGGMKGRVEPVWCTCKRQGVRSAVHMWPGSEAVINGCSPDYLDPYRTGVEVEDKVERVLGWLDMEDEVRPGFMGVYVPDVDSAGHVYGPESIEVAEALGRVDGMVGGLVAGILERNLSGVVDLVVVSDHGMATSSGSRVVFLDDLVDVGGIEHIDGWPLFGMWPKSNVSVTEMYANISAQHTSTSPWDVYLRGDIPTRYHFSRHDNPRIAPLWLIPRPGWAITTHDRFDPEIEDYTPRGIHGYDNASPLMRALFVGVGPGFGEWTPEKKAGPVANVDVYGIVTRLLGIKPNPNNGTLNGHLRP
ncbi:type I phosphodiesterase/nucleotide pyrophosphatase/phosphate transferase, partial [Saitoella complicata NRRL Y-17804]